MAGARFHDAGRGLLTGSLSAARGLVFDLIGVAARIGGTIVLLGRGLDALTARGIALAVVGAASAAVGRWAADGPERAPLETYLQKVVHPVLSGFGIG